MRRLNGARPAKIRRYISAVSKLLARTMAVADEEYAGRSRARTLAEHHDFLIGCVGNDCSGWARPPRLEQKTTESRAGRMSHVRKRGRRPEADAHKGLQMQGDSGASLGNSGDYLLFLGGKIKRGLRRGLFSQSCIGDKFCLWPINFAYGASPGDSAVYGRDLQRVRTSSH